MTQNPKGTLFAQFALVAKALGQPNRLELVESLAQGERGVEALSKATGMSIANTSQHLKQLRQAGLVTSRKDGTSVIYRLSGEEVILLFNALQRTAERHLAEVQQVVGVYYNARDHLEPISREELMARLNEGSVSVLDVRPKDEYAAGHVPGAINITSGELEKRLEDLPEGREVIAYCRGTWCVLSFNAVALLRAKGITARRLEDGYPEWKASGLPVEGTNTPAS
ncbi:MAG: metalloregulator ArsR/SmtB family transcription factor [bacterium]|nr:metalloregulator ArsR/SmtB family transcription factor [bacterium]